MEWRLRRVVPAAAVTTHAKPHAQQSGHDSFQAARTAERSRLMPSRAHSRAVTTHAKPHAQQQLARDLELERAAMEQRCRPQAPGLVSFVRVRIQNFLSHFPFDEI